MGLKSFDRIFFDRFGFRESLVVVEVDQVGGPIVLASLSAFGAVPSEVSYFSALETGVRLVPCSGRVALEVTLRTVPLIAVGVLLSAEVIASVISSVISSCWRSIPIYVHGNWSVVHPSWGI